MHAVVEVIPLLLHTSLIIFFAGLVAFLVPVNNSIMILSGFLLALTALIYTALTVLPLLCFDSPYRTPLSSGLWRAVQILRLFRLFLSSEKPGNNNSYQPASDVSMVDAMIRVAGHKSKQRDVRDHRALCWTVRSLTDDEELEPFVAGIPDVLWSSQGVVMATMSI
ncbi:hypothetical protein B0H12DRAFT_1268788 [Mycena haematopus]|nr:hypothetical protein B0H12DRAFT_1268788 [Mycena haematopus]